MILLLRPPGPPCGKGDPLLTRRGGEDRERAKEQDGGSESGVESVGAG